MPTLTTPAVSTVDDNDVVNNDVTNAASAQKPSVWSRPATKIAAAVLVLAVAIGGTWTLARSTSAPVPSPNKAAVPSTGSDGLGPVPAGQRRLTDKKAGYTLNYPAAWTEVTDTTGLNGAPDGHVIRIADNNAFSIRTFPLQEKVDTKNFDDMRAVTDAILSTPDANLTRLATNNVKVGGLPAIYYLYYFPNGNERGVHAHYFVFDGKKMHVLIFQVVPADSFGTYATQFDAILASFKPLAR